MPFFENASNFHINGSTFVEVHGSLHYVDQSVQLKAQGTSASPDPSAPSEGASNMADIPPGRGKQHKGKTRKALANLEQYTLPADPPNILNESKGGTRTSDIHPANSDIKPLSAPHPRGLHFLIPESPSTVTATATPIEHATATDSRVGQLMEVCNGLTDG
ncbi:hypothetical protein B0H34DRAFT_669650 [Crassisporium funariophilum]|nr:hypothetical protein B0H34DRAFT_669650 [Crassisporium funariophilum]